MSDRFEFFAEGRYFAADSTDLGCQMSVSPATTEQVTADAWRKPTLRHLLEETDRFLVAVELVTSRGVISDLAGQRVLSHARVLWPRAPGSTCSPSPTIRRGTPCSPPTRSAPISRSHGQEVIIHLACKDGNRNSLQSRGWKLASEGFDNILALTGDYPKPGYGGMARPSFDIDSVGLLSMYSEMNRGLFDEATGRRMKPTNFFLGAVVTNHKRHEREVVPQYLKLRSKIDTGARFIINQAGYDAAKGRRAVALARSLRAGRAGDRQRLRPLARRGPRLQRRPGPRRRRHR